MFVPHLTFFPAVSLVAESVKVDLKDGPGRCAGRVEIEHEGKWQRVNTKSWTDRNSDTVCRQRKCGNRRKNSNPEEKFSQGSGDFLPVVVNCKSGAKSISECMTKNPVDSVREKEAVGITCEGEWDFISSVMTFDLLISLAVIFYKVLSKMDAGNTQMTVDMLSL